MARDIETSRAADVREAGLKARVCVVLIVTDTALAHEAVLVYSPPAQAQLSALVRAAAIDSPRESAAEWRFVSDQQETLEKLATSGASRLHLHDAGAATFQYLGFKREALFGVNADRESPPRDL